MTEPRLRLERGPDGEIAGAAIGTLHLYGSGSWELRSEDVLALARLAAAEERERLTRDLDARCDAYWACYKGYDGKGRRSASDLDQGASNALEEAAQAYRRGEHWRRDGEK